MPKHYRHKNNFKLNLNLPFLQTCVSGSLLKHIIIMTLEFGKYRGKTLLELSDLDPSYLIWLAENSIVKVPSDLLNIAINTTMEPDFEDLHNDWGNRD